MASEILEKVQEAVEVLIEFHASLHHGAKIHPGQAIFTMFSGPSNEMVLVARDKAADRVRALVNAMAKNSVDIEVDLDTKQVSVTEAKAGGESCS